MHQSEIRFVIDGDQYVDRISSVLKQFELVRNALCEFKSENRLDAVAKEEIARFGKMMRRITRRWKPDKEKPVHTTASEQRLIPDAQKLARTSDEYAKATEYVQNIGKEAKAKLVREIEDAVNRVNQNELILLVTLFEIQMKDIHREILRQQPSRLNSERPIPLGKIIAEGYESIIELEIEREIQALDRKNVQERARYFHEHLGLDWTECTEITTVKDVLELRNRILHEDPSMTVTDDKLKEVRDVTLGLPFHCCSICVERHPEAFKQAEYRVYKELAEWKDDEA